MMAEDSNSDFLCLDLDPLTPYHVRDSMNERYWGSPQCSGDPTAGPEQADVMSSRDNSMSESRAATGQCSGYVKSSSPLISEKPEHGNGRRKVGGRRRKTLSPGRVKSFFLADIELDDFSDPLSYPDPPSGRRGEVLAEMGTNINENYATPTAERLPSFLSPTSAGEDNHFASSMEVAGLLDTPKWTPTTKTTSPAASYAVQAEVGKYGMMKKKNTKYTPDGGSHTRDILTPLKGDQIRSCNEHPMERCANRQLASENEEPSPSTIKRDWGSLKCSSSATTMDNGLSPKKSNRRRSFEIGHALSVQETVVSKNKAIDVTTSDKQAPHISSPLVPASATDGYMVPPAKEAGYSPEPGDANDDVGFLCREFVKSREDDQLQRKIAARIFCLTGYPLTPMAAQDCRTYCGIAQGMEWRVSFDDSDDAAAEKGMVNGIKDIVLEESGIETRSVISKLEKRALIVRLKPVLAEMAVSGEKERSEIEISTGICPRKLDNGAYEYVRCLDDGGGGVGMIVNEEVFMRRYLAYVNDVKEKRLTHVKCFLTAMGRLHTEELPDELPDGVQEPLSSSSDCNCTTTCTTSSTADIENLIANVLGKRDRGLRKAEIELWQAWEAALGIYHDEVQRCEDELRKEVCDINGTTTTLDRSSSSIVERLEVCQSLRTMD